MPGTLSKQPQLARYPPQEMHAYLDREKMTRLDDHWRHCDHSLAIALQEPHRALVQFVIATT
jgi:hypothetical protein